MPNGSKANDTIFTQLSLTEGASPNTKSINKQSNERTFPGASATYC